MLPQGPRSTYPQPPSPQPTDRDFARAMLNAIRAENARALDIRTGLMSIGCDGDPVIDPLDGTNCGAGGQQVLFNPRTRTVLGTLKKPAAATPLVTTIHPSACDLARAALRARRRFTDNLGNVYGPDGKWIGEGNPASLEADYVHRLNLGIRYRASDGSAPYRVAATSSLEKLTGFVRASMILTPSSDIGTAYTSPFTGVGQGFVYPSADDLYESGIVTTYQGLFDFDHSQLTGQHWDFTGLDDAHFLGAWGGTYYFFFVQIDRPSPIVNAVGTPFLDDMTSPDTSESFTTIPQAFEAIGTASTVLWEIEIDALGGSHDTFKWRRDGGSYTTGVSITGGIGNTLGTAGVPRLAILFGHSTGHHVGDAWTVRINGGDASLGRADTFRWAVCVGGTHASAALASGKHVSITADPAVPQALAFGYSVSFDSANGHRVGDWWMGRAQSNNQIVRRGVAVRGTLEKATACVNGGAPNSNVLMTMEAPCSQALFSNAPSPTGAHRLVVRDPDSLAHLNSKAITREGTGYSISTNDEGFFFVHCYRGASAPREIAVVSVNPLTFEPTVEEIITLEDNAHTLGSTFAVGSTAP